MGQLKRSAPTVLLADADVLIDYRDSDPDYRLGGHRLLVRSVDLNRDWPDIHRGLIGLAHELGQRDV